MLTHLALEPEAGPNSESLRDAKVNVLKTIVPLKTKNLVRGQFRGYRKEKGVAPDSKVETYAAMRLDIDSDRWRGVRFYLRAGKCLPATGTEVVVRLRQAAFLAERPVLRHNTLRLQISPEIRFTLGLNVLAPTTRGRGRRWNW